MCSVYRSRQIMGVKLAERILREFPDTEIDIVVPVPDTSRTAAMTCSETLKKPYREGFIKNRYIARTFIMPGQVSTLFILVLAVCAKLGRYFLLLSVCPGNLTVMSWLCGAMSMYSLSVRRTSSRSWIRSSSRWRTRTFFWWTIPSFAAPRHGNSFAWPARLEPRRSSSQGKY